MSDQIDFSQAVMASSESPDIRNWPIFAPITSVDLGVKNYVRGNVGIDFPGKKDLPPVIPPGWKDPISWTLWAGCQLLEQWHFAPWVECINEDYIPTGDLFSPNQVAQNLLYYADGPLNHYQPQPGEMIALVVTSGDTRRQNVQGRPPARTNVVIVPFKPGVYPQVTSTGPDDPKPKDPSQPLPQPPIVVTDNTQVIALLNRILEKVSNCEAEVRDLTGTVAALELEVLKQTDILTTPKAPLTFPSYTGTGSIGPFRGTVTLMPKDK